MRLQSPNGGDSAVYSVPHARTEAALAVVTGSTSPPLVSGT
jgi:hypothetical protein